MYLLCLQMRSAASWLAFLLDVSADRGNSHISPADSSWSSSREALVLCKLPAVEEKKEGREEKSSSATYNPREVLLACCDSPTISLLLCILPHPLLQVLQHTESLSATLLSWLLLSSICCWGCGMLPFSFRFCSAGHDLLISQRSL